MSTQEDVVVDFDRDQFEAQWPGSIEAYYSDDANVDDDDDDDLDDDVFFTVNGFPTVFTSGGDHLHWVDGQWISGDDLRQAGRLSPVGDLFRID